MVGSGGQDILLLSFAKIFLKASLEGDSSSSKDANLSLPLPIGEERRVLSCSYLFDNDAYFLVATDSDIVGWVLIEKRGEFDCRGGVVCVSVGVLDAFLGFMAMTGGLGVEALTMMHVIIV